MDFRGGSARRLHDPAANEMRPEIDPQPGPQTLQNAGNLEGNMRLRERPLLRTTPTNPYDPYYDSFPQAISHRLRAMIESLGQPQGSDNGIPLNRTDRQSLSPPRVLLIFHMIRQEWSTTALSNLEAGFRGSGDRDYGEGFIYHNNIETSVYIFSEVVPDITAPRVSDEKIKMLDRKTVDDEFVGLEAPAECSICLDLMKEGEVATYLPCKHRFHDQCIVPWLKEKNTCPACRAVVEEL